MFAAPFILPCNDFPYWDRVKLLLSQEISNKEQLVDVINKLTYKDPVSLKTFLSSPEAPPDFFTLQLPKLMKIALSIDKLFPTGTLEKLDQHEEEYSVVLSREQISCIIVHMFFCTMLLRKDIKYWVNYDVWYTFSSGPIQCYLRVLFNYFGFVSSPKFEEVKDEKVTFLLRTISNEVPWSSILDDASSSSSDYNTVLSKKLCQVDVRDTGRIGDYHDLLEFDFANEDVTYGRGGTQEEILLGMSPETHVVALICPTLYSNQSLFIIGARRFGDYSGYGLDLKYKDFDVLNQTNIDWNKRVIVAMDAKCYSEPDPFDRFPENTKIKEQIQKKNLKRELTKLYSGMKPISIKYMYNSCTIDGSGDQESQLFNEGIYTSHWGCGTFNGNIQLKFILQWIVASVCGLKKMVYYTLGDEDMTTSLSTFINKIRSCNDGDHQCSVKDLFELLHDVNQIVNDPKYKKQELQIFDLPQ
eukprot:TRINITY_DN7121_c2_g2_i1.p1 TRINITY_DN7121_c2_g2~~TRINITY_DN7121_c2_g2_i1.p1  ORF type:complete len:471 (+),score=63.64 TRINITY_DN7121_c2_g2_i1:75-1487(+)